MATQSEQDEMFELAVMQRSTMKMDYFGILVHFENFPSVKTKRQIHALLYGHDRITRLVCRHILPRLFPDQIEWLKSKLLGINEAIDSEWESEARRQWEIIKQRGE